MIRPPTWSDAASRTFQRTGGDIREVLRTILTSPDFRSAAAYGAKIKKPFELVASSLRAVSAQIGEPPPRTAGFAIRNFGVQPDHERETGSQGSWVNARADWESDSTITRLRTATRTLVPRG